MCAVCAVCYVRMCVLCALCVICAVCADLRCVLCVMCAVCAKCIAFYLLRIGFSIGPGNVPLIPYLFAHVRHRTQSDNLKQVKLVKTSRIS